MAFNSQNQNIPDDHLFDTFAPNFSIDALSNPFNSQSFTSPTDDKKQFDAFVSAASPNSTINSSSGNHNSPDKQDSHRQNSTGLVDSPSPLRDDSHDGSAPQNAQQRQGSLPNANSSLNPRSCVTCRKRKVKCDKHFPCSNCTKQGIECIFPKPGRAPRKTKKNTNENELLQRLRRLEGLVTKLGKDPNEDDAAILQGTSSPSPGANDGKDASIDFATAPVPGDVIWTAGLSQDQAKAIKGKRSAAQRDTPYDIANSLSGEMGRLVVGEGKSRYVTNSMWQDLALEINGMRDLLDESDEEEPEPISCPTLLDRQVPETTKHHEFIFGYSSTVGNLRSFHPPASQLPRYWEIFCKNVDVVFHVLHKPTSKVLFAQTERSLDELSKAQEALLFAVYHAVARSLPPEDCQKELGMQKDHAVDKYRFAAEQSLARANFLVTQETMIVQAFALYITCMQKSEDNKMIWIMTGLIVREAQSLGLHRDGSKFSLSHFDTEMRRRLWWLIATLDVRAAEDQGAEATLLQQAFDTQLPCNCNDDDIWPGMTSPPEPRIGFTEMTFDLVRYEIGITIRALNPPKLSTVQIPDRSEKEKTDLAEQLRIRLEEKVCKYCDLEDPLQWLTFNVCRLVSHKVWLSVHFPRNRRLGDSPTDLALRDQLMQCCIRIMQHSLALEGRSANAAWAWLFKSYFQGNVMIAVLAELCRRPTGPMADRAWDVLDDLMPTLIEQKSNYQQSVTWMPAMKLFARAKHIRMKALKKSEAASGEKLGQPTPTMSSAGLPGLPRSNTTISSGSALSSPGAMPGLAGSTPNGSKATSQKSPASLPDPFNPEPILSLGDTTGMDNEDLTSPNFNWNTFDESMLDASMSTGFGIQGASKGSNPAVFEQLFPQTAFPSNLWNNNSTSGFAPNVNQAKANELNSEGWGLDSIGWGLSGGMNFNLDGDTMMGSENDYLGGMDYSNFLGGGTSFQGQGQSGEQLKK